MVGAKFKIATDAEGKNFVKDLDGKDVIAVSNEKVVFGQVLVVPVEKESQYIATLNESSANMQPIKVARENNESN